jgi:opacity protein-like surface antigen
MMRLLISMAAIGGLALCSTLPGLSQGTRFYVRGGVGPAFTENTSLKEFLGAPVSDTRVKFDPGFQLRFAGGFHITDWLATEVESGVTYNTIRSITGFARADGDLANVPVLANLVLQCPTQTCRFAPYIGGGLGVSSAILHVHDFNDGTGSRIFGTDSDDVFAYHGFAGVRYAINDQMAVSLDYRFFGTTDPSWGRDFDRIRFGDNHTHSVTASFTYSF